MKISEKLFPILLGLSALFVAIIAATFSVLGIGMLFSGAPMSSMLMAASLEFGKLTATTFLYRFWKTTTWFLKTYLALAIIVLMLITSTGIFGWLTAAYQASAIKYEVTQQQVSILAEQKNRLLVDAETSKKRTESLSNIRAEQENRFSDALKNPTLVRNPTQLRQVQEQNLQTMKDSDASIAETQKKYDSIIAAAAEIDAKINEIKLDTTKTKDMITFKFIADAVGVDMNVAVKWFIVTIITVFDPLAICLILSYNVATYTKKEESDPISKTPATIDTTEEVKIPKEAEKLISKFVEAIDTVSAKSTNVPTSVATKSASDKKLHPSEYYSSPTR